MKTVAPGLMFAFLLSVAFTLGTETYFRSLKRADTTQTDEGAFKRLMGDGRRLFAGQFVEMADVYFHSGLYPSIFDRANSKSPKAVSSAADDHSRDDGHEGHHHDENGKCEHGGHDEGDAEHVKEMTPVASNWLEAFIHRFRITEHSHLTSGNEREILPWLKLAMELDPHAIETYTTAAYWLRTKLERVDQAEWVLREGLRNNPTNHVLLFEMGLLYKTSKHDNVRARNLWRAAAKCWQGQSEEARKDDGAAFSNIKCRLGELEEEEGNYEQALNDFEAARTSSPNPQAIQQWIERIKARIPNKTVLPPVP